MKYLAAVLTTVGPLLLDSSIASAQSQNLDPVEVPAPTPEAVPAAATPTWPRVGARLGLALHLISAGTSTHAFWEGTFALGFTSALTLKLDPHWMVDLEFDVYNTFSATGAARLTLMPGVLYNFGAVIAGVHAGSVVDAVANLDVAPLVMLPIHLSNVVNLYVQLDVPIYFFNRTPADYSFTLAVDWWLELQAGFAF